MKYERELSFFLEVLKKCHIHTATVSQLDPIESIIDPRLVSILGSKSDVCVQQVVGHIESHSKYKLTDEFNLKYICIRLPNLSEKNILFIGPYLSSPLSSAEILEIGERAGIVPNAQKILNEFFFSVPIITDNDRIFTLIDSFCEFVWQTVVITTVELNESYGLPILYTEGSAKGEGFDEIAANIKLMETRYSFENELIRAVTQGQIHKENLFTVAFNDQMFEKRTTDPLRNAKNYCIIMNTLLRKAAEGGGVHPLYVDRMSSSFASKIEQMTDTKALAAFMKEMFSSYCRLVHKHSMKQYSSLVKKTMLVIDSDISAELSLNSLAKNQGVSAGYLATVFKKETGKTVGEYIQDKRIDYATYLLSTTHLQIQTIALHCGIMDVQYFSKIFKKKTGKTPKEYREDSRTNRNT